MLCFFICGKSTTGIKGFAVRKIKNNNNKIIIKKPKGRRPVWKTSALFTSTPFSFFLIIWDLESSVAQAHLKAERLGHAWKHTCWTRFQHRVKIFLQPAIIVCSGLLLFVGSRPVWHILTQKTLWLPATADGTDWRFQQTLFMFTHSYLVENCFFCFCGSFLFCLCDCRVFEKQNKVTWNVSCTERRQQWLPRITSTLFPTNKEW